MEIDKNANPNIMYGMLKEAVNNSGYSMERAISEFDWLLEEERWKVVGDGFEDINDFLKTIHLEDFKITASKRKKIAEKLNKLQASQRKTAEALGVSHPTILNDLKSGNNLPLGEKNTIDNKAVTEASGNNLPPDQKLPSWTDSKGEDAVSREVKASVRLDSSIDSYMDYSLHPVLYGDNIYFLSGKYSEDRFDDIIVKDYNRLNTLTTLSRLFHNEKQEFTLREYARVQEFPDSFKFVGTYSSIKKQIGNAVSPTMGSYITKDLTGKTCGDLFAGCGGFSLGAEMNDIKSKWAIEWDKNAVATYNFNFSETTVINENITQLDPLDFEKVDIIIGGPPCQGFSNAGLKFKDDPRNELYKEFLRFVEVLKPGEFIMENVPQIQDIKDEIISDFTEIGYDVKTELVKGEDIGMRQIRKRFFFKGSRI